MTDEEVRQQVERTDAFIAAFRELIASTVVDPASPCEAVCHRGLERIAATVDAVDYITYANLANINEAGLMLVIEVHLMCVGGPPPIGLSGRGGLPSRIPAGDRRGIEAAPAIRGRSLKTGSRGVLLLSRLTQPFRPIPSDVARSIGRGKMMVELLSPAILSSVPR